MTTTAIYTNLADYFISAPLSSLYTVLLGLCMCIVFDAAGYTIFRSRELWMRASYFFSGLLVTGWGIWVLGLLQCISQPLLAGIALAFVCSGVVLVIKNRRQSFFNTIVAQLKPATHSRWLQYLALSVLFIFFCISLAPPTDADSLDYHLGIPVEMLRTGGLLFDKHNLHFRMVGFGEMLNLLGVANGCIQLGAFLQMLAVLWLLLVYIHAMPAPAKSYLYALFLAIPVLLFFVPGQKHQLTGIAATTLCFYMLSFQRQHFSKRVIVLWVATLLLAVGIKYSFIISAVALLVYALLQKKNVGALLLSLCVLGCIFIVPVLLFKYIHFSDPLSPLLEKFKPYPDPAVTGLARFLHNFRDPGFGFPLGVFLPASLGSISVTMGWCAVVLLFAFTKVGKYWRECVAVLLFIALTIGLGQRTARFFAEPYLWLLPIIILTAIHTHAGKYILKVGVAQFLLLIPFILFSFYLLSPGIISDGGREKLLARSAYGYAESRWLDEVLPADARIAADLRSRAWLPRPFFPKEYLYLPMKDSARVVTMDSMLKQYHINYLVLENGTGFEKFKEKYAGNIVAGPQKFTIATRNPFNSGSYELVVYKLK